MELPSPHLHSRPPRRRIVAVAVAALVSTGLAWRLRPRPRPVARAVVVDPDDHTVMDESGAVRSTQGADLIMPRSELDRIWDAVHLERLARTYWRFISRISLGVLRVVYTPGERAVVVLTRPFVLLRFHAPEYQVDGDRGIVRWRIKDGILVGARGRDRDGYLQIDVQRLPADDPNDVTAHVEVEVANFYPMIATRISTWLYKETQSRIHVLVTHAFLRSLARLDLSKSRVGHFETQQLVAASPQTLQRGQALGPAVTDGRGTRNEERGTRNGAQGPSRTARP